MVLKTWNLQHKNVFPLEVFYFSTESLKFFISLFSIASIFMEFVSEMEDPSLFLNILDQTHNQALQACLILLNYLMVRNLVS